MKSINRIVTKCISDGIWSKASDSSIANSGVLVFRLVVDSVWNLVEFSDEDSVYNLTSQS